MVSYYNHALSMFPTPGPTAPSSAAASGGHRSMGGAAGGGASSAASAAAAAVAAQSAYFPAAAAAGYGYHHPTAHQQFPGASQYPSLSDLNSNMYTAAAAAQFGPSATGAASAFDTSWGWPYNSCRGSANAVGSYDGWQPASTASVAASTNSPAAEVQNSSVSEGGGVAATSSTTSDGHSPNDSDPVQPAQLHPPSGSPSGYTTAPGPNSQSSGSSPSPLPPFQQSTGFIQGSPPSYKTATAAEDLQQPGSPSAAGAVGAQFGQFSLETGGGLGPNGGGAPVSPTPMITASVTSRPQPARSPYEWMKKPSYQSQPEKNGESFGGRTRTKDKYRIVYSDHQRLELEKEFHYSRYITIRRKAELANNVGLSERQVKIWFQNRRAKERRALKKHEDIVAKEKLDVAHSLAAATAAHAHQQAAAAQQAANSAAAMSAAAAFSASDPALAAAAAVGHPGMTASNPVAVAAAAAAASVAPTVSSPSSLASFHHQASPHGMGLPHHHPPPPPPPPFSMKFE